MVHGIDGRLSPEQMNIIAGAHREWCDARSIDPQSGHGLDAARAMMVMYQSGKIWRHELVAYGTGMAEEVGFEPTDGLPRRWFSRPVP